MATEITTNINSILEQTGIRDNVNFSQSSFNPAFYQFSFATPGDLNVSDSITLLYSPTTTLSGYIIDITGFNVTIDTIPFGVFLPSSFSSLIVLPPTGGTFNFDVRVVAAFNPVVIEMQRQDYSDNTTQSTWNNTYVAIPCGTNTMGEWVIIQGFEVGSVIQVITESGFAANYTVLNIYALGSVLYATFDKLWSLFNPYFLAIVNFSYRLNFYVTLRITTDSAETIYRDLRFTPDTSGMMRAEISGALRSLINLNFTGNLIDPSAIRTDETNLFSPFYFATKDNWIGSAESFITYYAPEDVKYCIAGAFQIGDPKNGYYDKYFANTEGNSFYPELMPQWVTQFENPVYFAGFPLTISFVGNATLINYEDYFIRARILLFNGTYIDYDSPASIAFTEFICLTRLNVPQSMFEILSGINSDAKEIKYRFGRLESGLFLDCLAPITFKVKRPIEQSCNTFYVRWLNTLGGWDYWLFEGKIYEGFKVENGNNYESYFDNISDTKDFENVTFKNVSPAVQVGSNTLTKNEAEGLKVLPTSPKIYWYNEELSKWIGVRVEPGTFNIRSTKDDYFNIELTFVKPKYFNQYA
jgi:hypothetical protein